MPHSTQILELLLSPLASPSGQFKVTVTKSPAGEGSADSSLPFVEGNIDWRIPLIRSLEIASFKADYFTTEEKDWMVKEELLNRDSQAFHPNLYQNIGRVLYRSLIPLGSKVERLMNESIQIARTQKKQLLVQLKLAHLGK